MVEIIENPVMMTRDEIKEAYDGKWVYVVNCEFGPGDYFMRGLPVVIADIQFEGVDTGLYDRYDTEQYGENLSMSFLHTPLYLNRSISFG